MQTRIQRVQEKLIALSYGALFVTNQQNVSYLTGFAGLSPSEREGFLFVTQNNAYLLTFPTYFGMYEKGGPDFTSLCITGTKRIADHLNEIVAQEHIHTISYEPENMTISELSSLTDKIKISFTKSDQLIDSLRQIKDDSEISCIRDAAALTDQAFTFIRSHIKKGVSERDLALEIEFFFKKNGADIAFAPIVALNQNAAIPHYMPDNRQQITDNTLILLDFGAKVGGYCADMTRVIFFGKPNDHFTHVYKTVLSAQQKAIEHIGPNISCSEPDHFAREVIEKSHFPTYPHGLGHGVGLAIHEAPRLRLDSKETLKPGMFVTVEPGIYLQGDCGVRIEDLVLITDTGAEILSQSTKEIVILS